MKFNQINNLPRMQDNWGNCATDAYQMQNDLNEFFNQNGYQLIDTPILEESELFIRKSGAEISTKLFSFIDQYGAKICLRPEITPSIIRHYIQNAENINLPFKIQYQGPIFRHDNTFRQNTQFGVEVIGGAQIEFESELICLAVESLNEIGVNDFYIKLGNIGLIKDILSKFELSNTLKLFAMNNINDVLNNTISITGLVEKAQKLGLLDELNSSNIKDPKLFLSKFSAVNEKNYLGRRTVEEILNRIELKSAIPNQKNNFISALNCFMEIFSYNINNHNQLDSIQQLIDSSSVNTTSVNSTKKLIEKIFSNGVSENSVKIDLGLTKGISYYTGLVFDIYQTVGMKPLVIGGGGRYDSLVKAFGGKDVPAIGFAYNLDSINLNK